MSDPTRNLLALGDVAELLAEQDAAHLFAGVVAVLEPYVQQQVQPGQAVLPVSTVLWLVGLLDRDVDLHTGTALTKLLRIVEPLLAGAARETSPDVPLGDGSGESLTDRELAVLRCLAAGMRNREIAKALFVAEDTVKTHLRTMFRKFGVTGRAHAVSTGYQLGLLSINRGGRARGVAA